MNRSLLLTFHRIVSSRNYAWLILRKGISILRLEGPRGIWRRLSAGQSPLSKITALLKPLKGRAAVVRLSQGGKVHGLLRASVELSKERRSDGAHYLRISDGAQRPRVHLFRKIDQGQTKIDLVIHTHLLQNGFRKILFEIVAKQGQIVWKDEVQLEVRNEGRLALKVMESLVHRDTPVVFEGLCDSSRYAYTDETLLPWYDRDGAEATILQKAERGVLTADEAAALTQFVRDGYMILPEKIPNALLEKINAELDEAIRTRYSGYEYGSSQRLEQMHTIWPGIRQLWLDKSIHRYLELLFEEPSQPCQSLVYVFGSQQDAHQDTIHLTSFPAGYMCGVWVALEDIKPNSGELEMYPGSHRLPRVYMRDVDCRKVIDNDWREFGSKVVPKWRQLLETSNLKKLNYVPERGTILLWHENLMHGGSVRRDKTLSRRSIVTHNFARGTIVFYDSTGQVGMTFPREGAKVSTA